MDLSVKILIGASTLFAVFNILRLFGVFEYNKSPSKAKKRVDDVKDKRKKIKKATRLMQFYAEPVRLFKGLLLPYKKEKQFDKWIRRLDIRNDTLNRCYTAEEYVGKMALPMVFGVMLIPLAVVFNIYLIAIPIGGVAWFIFQSSRLRLRVADEDTVLDDNFLDLYLLLYTQLRLGSRGRLRGTLENYLAVLEDGANTEENDIMKRFSTYFLNLLTTMEDHEAVVALRELYNSSVIINFCNVAGQALAGIDNRDNLLTFKMQLTDRKMKVMRIKQQKMVSNGEKAIYLIYIILFIFIGVGWVSKLPLDMFTSMF